MKLILSLKEKEIFSYFIREGNPLLNTNKIYNNLLLEGIKISKRTIKNTFDKYDQFNDSDIPSLLIKDFDKRGGTCYRVKEEITTFMELSRNLLNSKFSKKFFESEFLQSLLKKKIIMRYIEENLNVEFDEETRLKIHYIVQNSPSALWYGLFSKNLLSQKLKNEDELTEEAEHEIRENFISRLLYDLRDKDFFLSKDLEKLGVIVNIDIQSKSQKRINFDLELNYEQ